ncbi:hypothetical protein ES707_16154 [subsurface metagenome]
MSKNRKMTGQTINFILALSEKSRREKGNDITVDKEYIAFTILSGIYKVLVNEGYSKKHLDKFFWCDDSPDTHIDRENSSKIVEEFFNEDPAGIRLKIAINKLPENFNQ